MVDAFILIQKILNDYDCDLIINDIEFEQKQRNTFTEWMYVWLL